MEHASNIKIKDCYVGMEFVYNGLSYSEITKRWVNFEKFGVVSDIQITKGGRYKILVNYRSWSNGALKGESYLQQS